MKNFYIDTLQVHDYQQSLGYFIETPVKGLDMPGLRFSSIPRAGEHGALMANQLYDARLITLNGRIYGNTVSEYNLRRRALLNAVRVMKDANTFPVAKTLYFTTMDDLSLQVQAYLYGKPEIPMTNVLSGNFQISFYCPEFYPRA